MKKPLNFGPKKKARKSKAQDPDALVTFWLTKVPDALKKEADALRRWQGYTRREMVQRVFREYIDANSAAMARAEV